MNMNMAVDTQARAFLCLFHTYCMFTRSLPHCVVCLWRTFSGLSASYKVDADFHSVTLLLPCFTCQTSAGSCAKVGWKLAGPEDPARVLLSPPCSRHPALPFSPSTICSRLLQNRASLALMEWLVLNVTVDCCHLIYLNSFFQVQPYMHWKVYYVDMIRHIDTISCSCFCSFVFFFVNMFFFPCGDFHLYKGFGLRRKLHRRWDVVLPFIF